MRVADDRWAMGDGAMEKHSDGWPVSNRRYSRLPVGATRQVRGFTLMELLVVLGIIGMLTALSLPFMKGINRSSNMSSATRQMLDDLEYARHRAISGRTTVYMIFMPPVYQSEAGLYGGLQGTQPTQWTNLLTGQQVSYAFYTERGVGEQPGQLNRRYLGKWYSLPQGIFIPDFKFTGPARGDIRPFQLSQKIPIPTLEGVEGGAVPFIAFNHLGQLWDVATKDVRADPEVIPLSQGSIFLARDSNGLLWDQPDIQETPPNNYTNNLIYVDPLTGRARLVQPTLPP